MCGCFVLFCFSANSVSPLKYFFSPVKKCFGKYYCNWSSLYTFKNDLIYLKIAVLLNVLGSW